MLMFEDLLKIVKYNCIHGEPVIDNDAQPKAIKIDSKDLVKVCLALYQNESTYFDMLSCITGIDNGVQMGTMEIAYNLYSIPYNLHLMLKVTLARDAPAVDSLTDIWKTANWHERELYDMFGIHVNNHPDLRRILLPADWDGHPLKKDYKQQETYRNIKLDY